MIPLHRPYLDSEEIAAVSEILESGWLTQGPKVEELENKVKDISQTEYAIACTNCTSALHLALMAIDVGPGDDVLVADYTFPATGHAVVHCGANPIFVDSDPATYNMDCADLEKKIKLHCVRPKAVLPIHAFGQCADMDTIMDISKEHGLFVIEDAACAMGSKYKGRPSGSLADIGCFSFHATKVVTTGEGGMVTTNDEKIAEKVGCLRNLGIGRAEASWNRDVDNAFTIPTFAMVGYNYRMTDIVAAIGLVQLAKLDSIVAARRSLASYWDTRLSELSDFITAPFVCDYSFHNFHGYTTLVSEHVDRNKLIQELKNRGVSAQIGTYASHLLSIYDCEYSCFNSADIYNRSLRLPLFYGLTPDVIDTIIEILKEIFALKNF